MTKEQQDIHNVKVILSFLLNNGEPISEPEKLVLRQAMKALGILKSSKL